jgi:acetoacetyl-CoA reductase
MNNTFKIVNKNWERIMSRVAVVTGGTRGIGKAISIALKDAGYQVAATYRNNDEKAKAFSDQTGIHTYKWDVSNSDSCREGIEKIEKELGSVDVLVNNAGITRDRFFHKMTDNDWHDVTQTNLNSCFTMCRSLINPMRERGFGRIINISSINGQAGQMGQVNYSAAKAGIIGFTKALALENATKGITVNAIAPGYISTEMTEAIPEKVRDSIVSKIPIGRMGKPEEIARAVLFLADDQGSFITGSTLSLNGGQHLV